MADESLHSAVADGDSAAVAKLLETPEGRRSLNLPNARGECPVHLAIAKKQLKILKQLLDAGANVNEGSSETGSQAGYTAAHYAARNGDVDALQALKEAKADFNRKAKDDWAPLHAAAFSGKSQALAKLIELGADVNVENNHRLTPVVFAANHGKVADVRLLVSKGATLELTDALGDSLMHHVLHHQMQKLFEGNYDMPEVQFDVAVTLAIAGCDPMTLNRDGHRPCHFLMDDIPNFERVLRILYAKRDEFKKSKTQWNYMTLLSGRVEHFMGMGLDMKTAVDLYEAMQAAEKERQEDKKARAEERPAGGCPVMSGPRKRKGKGGDSAAAAAAAPPADGSDPSGGKCPFFQKKDGAAAAAPADHAEAAVPAGHPKLSPEEVKNMKPGGDDPSGGKCPFFQKKDGAVPAPAAVTATAHSAAPTTAARPAAPAAGTVQYVEVVKDADTAPALNWEFVYANRVTLLLMLTSFFLGMFLEQRIARHFGQPR